MGFVEREQLRTKRKSPVETAVAEIKTGEQIEGQENINDLEGGKYMPSSTEQTKKESPHREEETKKRGRPKVNRELKKRITFTVYQSIYEQASEIAYENGKSVSEIVTEFLESYVKKNK